MFQASAPQLRLTDCSFKFKEIILKKILVSFANFFKTMERTVAELISATVVTLAIIATLVFGNWEVSAMALMIFAIFVIWGCVYRDYTWPFIKKHSIIAKETFVDLSIDLKIATVLTFVSLIALAFFSWTATFWLFGITSIAWAVVYRKEATIPAIAWCWKESKPSRKQFGSFLCSHLFGDKGFPIVMISWGVMSSIIAVITLFVFKSENWATTFGIAGFSGIIYGAFLQQREKHLEGCKIRAREAEALAVIAKNTPKPATTSTPTTVATP